ncbi:MAG: tetratricopeptide repeat protein, partial [Deltaproteobacteria bacterium]
LLSLQDGDYVNAEERFQRARAIRELPAVVYDLALSQRGRGHIGAALDSLRRYLELAEARGPVDPSRRAEVETLQRTLRASFARVTLHVASGTLDVRMAGAPISDALRGGPILVDPGTHVFAASGPSVEPVEVTRELHAGEAADVTLAPGLRDIVTSLHVSPSQSLAEVLLDGILVGTGDVTRRVRPGPHRIEARASGFERWSANLSLAPGAMTSMRADLVRIVPIYERWWLWTGVGVVVVGGITAAIVASQSGPRDCTPSNGGCIPFSLGIAP